MDQRRGNTGRTETLFQPNLAYLYPVPVAGLPDRKTIPLQEHFAYSSSETALDVLICRTI